LWGSYGCRGQNCLILKGNIYFSRIEMSCLNLPDNAISNYIVYSTQGQPVMDPTENIGEERDDNQNNNLKNISHLSAIYLLE
jgi:hypothetical protein